MLCIDTNLSRPFLCMLGFRIRSSSAHAPHGWQHAPHGYQSLCLLSFSVPLALILFRSLSLHCSLLRCHSAQGSPRHSARKARATDRQTHADKNAPLPPNTKEIDQKERKLPFSQRMSRDLTINGVKFSLSLSLSLARAHSLSQLVSRDLAIIGVNLLPPFPPPLSLPFMSSDSHNHLLCSVPRANHMPSMPMLMMLSPILVVDDSRAQSRTQTPADPHSR
jgi:hypothetical protein